MADRGFRMLAAVHGYTREGLVVSATRRCRARALPREIDAIIFWHGFVRHDHAEEHGRR